MLEGNVEALAREIRSCKDHQRGRELEAAFQQSNLRSNLYLSNLFVEMHSNCGSLAEALSAFTRIPTPNRYSWTILLHAYARHGHLTAAREIFNRIPEPDRDLVCWNVMIQAYISDAAPDEARRLFDGMPQRTVLSWTEMIPAYSCSRRLEEARCIFDAMPEWNLISWNAMLAAHAQNGDLDGAGELLNRMPQHDAISCTTMIAAYAAAGRLTAARDLFHRMPHRDLFSWTTMLQAHAQNAHLRAARIIFRGMPEQNRVSWTALIHAFSHRGLAPEALGFFRRMILEGEEPDEVTLVAALTACARIGSLPATRAHLGSITADFRLRLQPQHYTCMTEALARCGRLDLAEELLGYGAPDAISRIGFISACRLHRDLGRAEGMFRRFLTAEEAATSEYVLLSSLYVPESKVLELDNRTAARAPRGVYKTTRALDWQVGLKS